MVLIENTSKKDHYETLTAQMKALLKTEADVLARSANFIAAIQEQFKFLWIGFYRVQGNMLKLGPFQGPVACVDIAKGKGVCGTAWLERRTIVVPDVHAFPGHIACSSLSKSEIVVPVVWHDKIIAVLDIDSEQLHSFDELDQYYLEQMIQILVAEGDWSNF